MSFVSVGEYTFPVLVAISEDEQNKGLMEVSWPPPVMAFIYAKPQVNKFWMKNTIVPLDIVFCRNNRVINIKRGSPLSELPIGDDVLTDLVVEFPRGSVEQFGIEIDSIVKINYNVSDLHRKFENKLTK
jgi:uncharacterized membrane protein (UPF0127 family)